MKGHVADTNGNVIFNKAARNFNPDVAMSGRTCIVEVEKIVPVGELDPDHIHLQDAFVDRIVLNENPEKQIEFRTISTGEGAQIPGKGEQKVMRERIVRRAAKEIRDGMYVNLGIGIPTLCSNFLDPGV